MFAYDNLSSTQLRRSRESGQRNEPTHIARAFVCQFATRINSPFHATEIWWQHRDRKSYEQGQRTK